MRMGTAIVVASGKGGTGKTTSVGALASCLACMDYRTLCLDCDVGLKNLDLTLGLTDMAFTDFGDIFFGDMKLEKAIIAHPDIENLYFLSAPVSVPDFGVCMEKMPALMAEIRDKFDFCLIDSPAGIGRGFSLAAECADRAIVVVTGDASSFRSGQRVVMELEKLGVADTRLLVNRVHPKQLYRTYTTVDDIIDAVGARLIGLVAEDPDVTMAANFETPLLLYETKGAISQYRRIAERLVGNNVPLGRL